jgi:hypothetical protein
MLGAGEISPDGRGSFVDGCWLGAVGAWRILLHQTTAATIAAKPLIDDKYFISNNTL